MARQHSTAAKRHPASPLTVDIIRLGRRPGSMVTLRNTVPNPSRIGAASIAIEQGAPLDLDLRLESVSEGVLVTGTVSAPWRGVCRRCTTPIDGEFNVSVKERFCDPDPERHVLDDELAYEIGDDQLDLGPMMRDAIVLELPLAPLCLADCAGLCAECGADRNVEACTCVPPVDPRWATLDVLRSSRDVDRPVEHAREGT